MTTICSLNSAACWFLAALCASQIPPPGEGPGKPPELRAHREEILSKERAKLRALAARLRSEGKAAEADRVEAVSAEETSVDGSSRFVLLPEVVEPPKATDAGRREGGPAGLEAIRVEAARSLFDLAVQAARPPESFALADECLRDVIARQPDHPEARRLLGFVPHRQTGWATPFAARMLAEGSVNDATYGWVKADWVPHLNRGELPDRSLKRWMPAAEADALRRDWSTRWVISTEHFRIDTNVPLNEAISFGRKLEDLHQLFFSLMADVIDPDRLPLAQRFKKKPDPKTVASASKKAHQVFYFATREEYSQYLAPFAGEGAQVSLGTYIPRKEDRSRRFGEISYFFNDVGGLLDVESTLYHEGSHQLLFEAAGSDDFSPKSGQYWVFEGLGTYFETLQHEPDGVLRIGGLVGPRIAQARRRLIGQGEFIPIEQFVSYNRPKFQGDNGVGDIVLNYAQSMALAVYLMQADGGRHREEFLEYVRDVYKGRYRGASGRSLEEKIGTRFPELNRACLAYLATAARR